MRRFEKCTTATDTTKLPQRSTEQAAGYDFYSPVSITIGPKQWGMVRTHIKAKMAADDVLMIFPRSSMGCKKHLMLSNTVGIIDSDYYNNPDNEGNIVIALYNYGDREQHIAVGDKIAQGIFLKFGITDNDFTAAKAERRGGIGSTGE